MEESRRRKEEKSQLVRCVIIILLRLPVGAVEFSVVWRCNNSWLDLQLAMHQHFLHSSSRKHVRDINFVVSIEQSVAQSQQHKAKRVY